MPIESHLVFLIEYLIVHHDVLLLGSIPEVLIDIAYKVHDIHTSQHLEAQAIGIDFPELHQLGNEARQSLCTPHRRLHGGTGNGPRLFIHNLTYGTLNDGERRAELMGNMGKEVDTEIIDLLLHLHFLVKLEFLLTVTHNIITHNGNHQEINHPRIPHIVPRFADMNLQRALLRPLVTPSHRTEMKNIVARLQSVITH